jgi:hypothetical protein
MCEPILVGGRAYPLRRCRRRFSDITGYPAVLWPGQRRRCAACASPAQRARAKEEAVRR